MMKRCTFIILAILLFLAGTGCMKLETDINDTDELHAAGTASGLDSEKTADTAISKPVFYIESSDAAQAETFFADLVELPREISYNGGELRRITSKNAPATRTIDISGKSYEAEYMWTETDSADPEAETALLRYGSYDHYRLTTEDFTAVMDYLSGTDRLCGYIFEPADESVYGDAEINIEEARTVCKGFVEDKLKLSLSGYSVIKEFEDSDGSYCFIYSVEKDGIPTNDTIVVGVAKSGYVYGVSAKKAGISGCCTLPTKEDVESGIEAILLYMSEKGANKAEDTGTRSIWFGNDGNIYAGVKFASKAGPEDLAFAFSIYTRI